jgi:hypothetical protein
LAVGQSFADDVFKQKSQDQGGRVACLGSKPKLYYEAIPHFLCFFHAQSWKQRCKEDPKEFKRAENGQWSSQLLQAPALRPIHALGSGSVQFQTRKSVNVKLPKGIFQAPLAFSIGFVSSKAK